MLTFKAAKIAMAVSFAIAATAFAQSAFIKTANSITPTDDGRIAVQNAGMTSYHAQSAPEAYAQLSPKEGTVMAAGQLKTYGNLSFAVGFLAGMGGIMLGAVAVRLRSEENKKSPVPAPVPAPAPAPAR